MQMCRSEFEQAMGQGFDFSLTPDAWGRPAYLHSHIEAMFAGWKLAKRGGTEDSCFEAWFLKKNAMPRMEQLCREAYEAGMRGRPPQSADDQTHE